MTVLLKNLLCIYSAPIRRFGAVKKNKTIAAIVGLVFLPAMIILQTQNMFKMWLFLPNGVDLLFGFVSLSMLGVFFLLFLTGLPSAMHHFFMAEDLAMLLSFPVKSRHVFLRKFIQVVVGNFGMFALLGLPLLLSVIAAVQINFLLVLFVVLGSILLVAIASGLSVIASLCLARFFVIKKVRRFATLIMGFFVISAWISFQFLRISVLDPSSIDFDPSAVESFTAHTSVGAAVFLPSAWLVDMVRSFYAKNFVGVGLYFFALSSAAFVMIVILSRGRELLDRFDLKIEAGGRRGAARTIEFKSPSIRFCAAILFKDIRLVFRDTRFFQSNLIFVAMLIVAPFLTSVEQASTTPGTLQLLQPYIPVVVLTLIVSAALGRQSVPMERLAFQYVKLSPINLRHYLVVKALRPAIFVIGAATIALLLSAGRFETPKLLLLHVTAVIWLLVVGAASLGQLFGVLAGNFNWTDPRYMVDMSWTLLSTFVHVLYGALGVGVLVAGYYLNQSAVAFVLFFFYVGFVMNTSTRMAVRRLDKLDWIY